jgi:anti-sigma B factor antagonist
VGTLDITENEVGGEVRVFRVAGEVDFGVAPELKKRIADAVGAGERQLVVDLSAVSFIDSTAIGVLVATLKRMRESGGTLSVVCDNEDVRGIFEVVGLEDVLPLHRSDEDAFAALAHHA